MHYCVLLPIFAVFTIFTHYRPETTITRHVW